MARSSNPVSSLCRHANEFQHGFDSASAAFVEDHDPSDFIFGHFVKPMFMITYRIQRQFLVWTGRAALVGGRSGMRLSSTRRFQDRHENDPYGAPACEVLASLAAIEGNGFVFPAASGDSHFQGVEKVWRDVCTAAGLPSLPLHDFRRSFASVGFARGDALAIIGAILGYTDVKTTSRYAHLADDPFKTPLMRSPRSASRFCKQAIDKRHTHRQWKAD